MKILAMLVGLSALVLVGGCSTQKAAPAPGYSQASSQHTTTKSQKLHLYTK